MSTPKCIVRGSINNDEYFYVDTITKPGETKSSTRHASRIGGKGANQAVAIARAGGQVQFYGTIGKDGLWIKEELSKEHGIDVSGILVSDKGVPLTIAQDPTGRAIIQVSDDGENSIILFAGSNHSSIHEESHQQSPSDPWFPNATHLLLQNEIALSSTLLSLQKAKSQGLITIFNPSPMLSPAQTREFPWDNVDWLLINEGEGQALWLSLQAPAGGDTTSAVEQHVFGDVPELKSKDEAIRYAKEVIRGLVALHPAFATTNIVYTLGAEGALAYVPSLKDAGGDGTVYTPAAELRGDVRDTTGAGDCFTGYFVAELMKHSGAEGLGKDAVESILRKCNQAAGMSVERSGTIDSIPTLAEVEARLGL